MASQEEKIKKLEDEVNSMEAVLTTFGNLFNADGHIDDNEQAQLDNMSRMIRKIKAKIKTLKKSKNPTSKATEIPKKFSLGLRKIQEQIQSMQEYISKAEQTQKINSKSWSKMIKRAEISIFKLRKYYGDTSPEIFQTCKTQVENEESNIEALQHSGKALIARIIANKKKEAQLDSKMKALLNKYKCPRELYKDLKQTIEKVENDFQQFISANL